MKKCNQRHKKIASQIKFWLAIGIIVLTAFMFTGMEWIQTQDDIIKKVISAIIITAVIIWWTWASILICQIVNRRNKEQKLIIHLFEQIREIRKELKDRFFK